MEKKINLITGKKLVAILMVLLIFISNLSSVLAVSGTGTWKGYHYSTYIRTTESHENGISLRSFFNVNTGEAYTAFCAEYGVDFYNGLENKGTYYTPTSASMKKACKIAYFGWYSKYRRLCSRCKCKR